jgi:thiol-disulfide isomerase/thioredoxin
MKALLGGGLIGILLFCHGCTDKNTPSSKGGASQQHETTRLIAQARSGKVVGVNEHQIQAIIEGFKGEKVVLVNFWATWCQPCVEEFPDLVRLYQTYQPKGLEVIAVSADSPKSVESKIKPFLEKNNATFIAFVKDAKDDGAFIDAIDKEWGGELPVTFIYDRSGQRAASFYGKEDWNGFVAAVEPLLE